ncbi:hypothetical protein G3N59_35455 [Paraburkholderia sp. Ac-20340]|nr:hypothetical protein [Paraburkholderia sp. Ac-20340]
MSIAPHLLITITGDIKWEMDRERLQAYLRKMVGGGNAQEPRLSDWGAFAQSNNLMAAGQPLTKPDVWYLGTTRWVTATWGSEWDVHVHFGFVDMPGMKRTHLKLLADTSTWLPHLPSNAKQWWRFYRQKPNLTGEARLAGLETGIEITRRVSFKDYVRTTARSTAVGVAVPVGLAMTKAAQLQPGAWKTLSFYVGGAITIAAATFVILWIQHKFATSAYSWGVAQSGA